MCKSILEIRNVSDACIYGFFFPDIKHLEPQQSVFFELQLHSVNYKLLEGLEISWFDNPRRCIQLLVLHHLNHVVFGKVCHNILKQDNSFYIFRQEVCSLNILLI